MNKKQYLDVSKIKIEDGIKIGPKIRYSRRTELLKSMKLGQSFTVSKISYASSICMSGRRIGFLFSVRREADGYRVWRIK